MCVPKFREIQCVLETQIILERNTERKGCNSVVYRGVLFGKRVCLKCEHKCSEFQRPYAIKAPKKKSYQVGKRQGLIAEGRPQLHPKIKKENFPD